MQLVELFYYVVSNANGHKSHELWAHRSFQVGTRSSSAASLRSFCDNITELQFDNLTFNDTAIANEFGLQLRRATQCTVLPLKLMDI